MKAISQILVRIFLTLSLVTGCAASPQQVGGFNLVSIEEETKLGQQVAVEIEKKHQVVNDPEVQNFINRVGQRLLSGARKVEFPFSFKVVQDENLNAFALPGGFTYVHTGLIKAAANEAELAAVMAHEINHVVARHSTQQLTKQYGYQLATGLLLGGNQSQVAQIAAELFGQAGLLYYSREMETQADILGLETMYKAGYNPQGMATFFEKLQAQSQSNPSKVATFFSSHPATADRIQKVREEISKFPPKSYQADSPDFQRVKAKLK